MSIDNLLNNFFICGEIPTKIDEPSGRKEKEGTEE